MNTHLKILLLTLIACVLHFSVSAGEFPIPLGAGSDTVFLKTGVSPDWEKRASFHKDLSAALAYDEHMKVRQITVGFILAGKEAAPAPTLDGISLGDQKEDVLTRLGKPTAELPSEPQEWTDTYRLVWILQDRILILSLWKTDQKNTKWRKDTVAFMSLRAANF